MSVSLPMVDEANPMLWRKKNMPLMDQVYENENMPVYDMRIYHPMSVHY